MFVTVFVLLYSVFSYMLVGDLFFLSPVHDPRNVVTSSNCSWTPPQVQPAWRSPRQSLTHSTSGCSTPQGPFAPKRSENGRPSLSGSGTTTPPAPNLPKPFPPVGTSSYCPQPMLAPFPKMPASRNTIGVPQAASRSYTPLASSTSSPTARPLAPQTVAPLTARPPVPPVPKGPPQSHQPQVPQVPSSQVSQLVQQSVGIHPDDLAAHARQSLGRRMWRSGNGKAIGPPCPHHEKDDNLTSVCVKVQQKLGKLSTKKTISLWPFEQWTAKECKTIMPSEHRKKLQIWMAPGIASVGIWMWKYLSQLSLWSPETSVLSRPTKVTNRFAPELVKEGHLFSKWSWSKMF